MLRIVNNRITLTRGDTAELFVNIADIDGKKVAINSSDKVAITIKKDTESKDPLLYKEADQDGRLLLLSEDTSALPYGEYIYDIQLTKDNGYIYTIIPPTLFIIDGEVSNNA